MRQDCWDDFGYKTYFHSFFVVNGEDVEIDSVRILFENEDTSLTYLNRSVQEGWNGWFPLNKANYVSVPSSIDFYKVIHGKLGKDEAIDVAIKLRDASYFVFIEKDKKAIKLTQAPGFESSLQRESGSIKAFTDGWEFFGDIETNIKDFNFKFIVDESTEPIEIRFKFNSQILPYDINVLVGPNGIGKSQALQHLVEFLLRIERGSPDKLKKYDFKPFSNTPNFSHIIVVSYSPFESFILDVDSYSIQDKEVYKYFGFRKRRRDSTSTAISRNRPAQDSVESLLKCIKEDQEFDFIEDWVNKSSLKKCNNLN